VKLVPAAYMTVFRVLVLFVLIIPSANWGLSQDRPQPLPPYDWYRIYVERELQMPATDLSHERAKFQYREWAAKVNGFVRHFNAFLADLNKGKFNAGELEAAEEAFHRFSDPKFCKAGKEKKP
jgi:hypothetical protein